MKKKLLYYITFLICIIVCLNKNFIDIFEMSQAETNLIFNDVFVETCKATLTVRDTGRVYDDLEILLIYKQTRGNTFYLEEYSNSLFKEACLQFVNDRCVFHMNGYWMSGERSFLKFNSVNNNDFNDLQKIATSIDLTFIITYQENDKLNLNNLDKVFPIMQNYDKIAFELKGPFKRWSCQLTSPTIDLESVIDFYNKSNKRLKTSFIMPIDKSNAQLLILIDDPIKGPYNYSKIFGGGKK